MAHEYIELTNRQIEEAGLDVPVHQFTEDFDATCVHVVDGDTIRLGHESRDFDFPLRFLGVDAPEMNEGGEEAKEWLKSRIEGQRIKVLINKKNRVDKYGRLLGRPFYRGLEIAQEMLYLGLAKPFSARHEGKLPQPSQYFSLSQWL